MRGTLREAPVRLRSLNCLHPRRRGHHSGFLLNFHDIRIGHTVRHAFSETDPPTCAEVFGLEREKVVPSICTALAHLDRVTGVQG